MPELSIEDEWKALYADGKYPADAVELADVASHLVGRKGLGLGARMAILYSVIGLTADELIARVYPEKRPHPQSKRHLQDAGQIHFKGHIKDYIVDDVFEWFCTSRESDLTLAEFRFKEFKGAAAVDHFKMWLMAAASHAAVSDPTLMGKSAKIKFHEKGRDEALRALTNFLAVDEDDVLDAGAPKIVQVVTGAGMVQGLRALAGHLMAELKGDGRPVVFLPVGRYPEGVVGCEGANISFATLVGNLQAFCRGEALPAADPPRSPAEIREAILWIREHLTGSAKVLIFEGAPSSLALAGLNATILDDGLAELLNEIVHPRMPHEGERPDARTFYRNRIIVLSEGAVIAVPEFQRPAITLQPPDRSCMDDIIDSQERRHRHQLKILAQRNAMFRTDGALAILDDLLDNRLKSNPDFDAASPPGDWLKPSGVVAAWMKGLRPLERLILRLVALSRDGLRMGTLLRLLEDWATMQDKSTPEAWTVLPPKGFSALESAIAQLVERQLLVLGRDEPIRGLDDPVMAYSDLAVGVAVDPNGPQTIDFPTAMLRSEILRELFPVPTSKPWKSRPAAETANAPLIARAHRMIAEAALAQFTIVARHADWTDTYDAGHYRRLIQAIFHGFASLALGPETEDAALRKPRHTLPTVAQRTYERLYAVYYLGLIEAPPAWELSRTLGREDLKIDLILSAMNADQLSMGPWNRLYGFARGLDGSASGFHRDPSNRDQNLAFHQNLALARASYHRADYLRAREALARCGDALPPQPDKEGESDPWFTDRIALEKTKADVLLASPESVWLADHDPQKQIRDALTIARCPDASLEELSSILEMPAAARSVASGWALDKPISDLAERWAEHATADELAGWADLLCRLAEADAQQSDGTLITEQQPLMVAFSTVFFAERLRRAAFEKAPLSRKFYVNGHSTRFFVRTALELAHLGNRLEREEGTVSNLPSQTYLAELARRHIDVLTRYLHRVPTERASLLVLEAAYQRGFHGKAATRIAAAMHCLEQADELLANTTYRPRVRLRYTLERLQVLLAAIELDGEIKDIGREKGQLALEAAYEESRLRVLTKSAAPSWLQRVENLTKARERICDPILQDFLNA